MIKVSDHALVRFLDRSGAAEVEALRVSIAQSLERARRNAERAGIADYTIVADGLRYVIQGDVLVTVLTDAMPVSERGRRRR